MLKNITTFLIPKMDCPCEEQMIRLTLSSLSISKFDFDIPARKVIITHLEEPQVVLEKLIPLGFGAQIISTELSTSENEEESNDSHQKRVLWILLILNGLMFFIEGIVGWLDNSAGLMADGLDMLSDAVVYGIALFAVGKAANNKLKAAQFAGVVEIILALVTFGRVAYQVYYSYFPQPESMIGISLLALAVNVYSLFIIRKEKDKGVHMKASYIFSANDVIANLGVIVAGFLVIYFNSPLPDWIIGIIIGFVVLSGAIRILKLKK